MSGTPPGPTRAGLVLVPALLLGLAGCSFDVQVAPTQAAPPAAADPNTPADPNTVVAKDALAQQLTDELARQTGQQPGPQTGQVSCPADLPRTTGANLRCDVLQAGQPRGTVTATINNQGRISYFFDVLASPPPSPAPGPGR